MIHRVPLRFRPKLPQWWRNLLTEVSDEYGAPYQEVIEQKLKKHNGHLENGVITFKTDQDWIMFLLRYS